jgi:hypothetical protein
MSSTVSLKELEKSTWKSFFESGFVDITIGLIFIVSSVCHIFDDQRYFLMPLYAVPTLFLILANRFIVVPRMGIVKFSQKRKKRSTIFTVIMTFVLLFLLTLTIFSRSSIFPDGISARIFIIAIILLICFANAFFLDFSRLYLYGVVIAAAFNVNEMSREIPGFVLQHGYAYLGPALIVLTIGGVLLYRFLKKYPVPAEGKYDDN